MDAMPVDRWTLADMPDQAGRVAVVTGPSVGGLGFHTALELARRGARVVLAGRSPTKLEAAAAAIEAELGGDQEPPARLELDLADLDSVRRAAERLTSESGSIDVLVNNAGVVGAPRHRTADGFELTLATNHLGPFLLTGLLLPQLVASEAGVVVTVSSLLHRRARSAPLEDPRASGHRSAWRSYGRSKLANLLFTLELDRRCREAEIPVKALAAHPGFAGSRLAVNSRFARATGRAASIYDAAVKAISQPVDVGAWPTLMAATADLPGSTFCGPSGRGERSGPPQVVAPGPGALDEDAQRRLWQVSEDAVGLSYP